MKPRVSKLLVVFLAYLLAVYWLAGVRANPSAAATLGNDTPLPLGAGPSPTTAAAENVPPHTAASPADAAKSSKKPKAPFDPNATPKPPKIKKPKDIPFPLPKDNSALNAIIPENGLDGKLLSQIMALKMTRISNELVKMEGTKMELNHPDGKNDFHIDLPASVFNLQTHIITSEQPVTVSTQDFELTGEKMEFNTVDRTGKLIGKVHMHIHNLKQVAGPQQSPTP